MERDFWTAQDITFYPLILEDGRITVTDGVDWYGEDMVRLTMVQAMELATAINFHLRVADMALYNPWQAITDLLEAFRPNQHTPEHLLP
jgi:hypothetical protein